MTDWVNQEYSFAKFGDRRLNKRGGKLLSLFSKKPTVSIPQSCQGWSETHSAYRFFNNPKVTVEKVLSPHRQATIKRMKSNQVVLLVQDTTEFDFTGRKITGSGPLSYDNMLGFLCHTSIAITPERLCLGVVDTKFWSRAPETFHRRKSSKERSIEEKESYRWVEGYQHAHDIQQQLQSTQIVSVSDREGDIYECFSEASSSLSDGKGANWIIRSYVDRSLLDKKESKGNTYKKVKEQVASAAVLGNVSFTVSATKSRKKRLVSQTIRAEPLTLKPPFRKGKKLPPVSVNVILAREEHPPAGEEPIEWCLLTSLPISTFEETCLVINYYLCRWQIEIFFKILKSGCAVEKIQFETDQSLLPCIALFMIIAWRVFFLLMLGRTCPEIPCTAVFEEDEWQAAYRMAYKKIPPAKPPPLGDIIVIIAQFGGYMGRKSDGPPGPKALWSGIQSLYHYTIAWKTFQELNEDRPP